MPATRRLLATAGLLILAACGGDTAETATTTAPTSTTAASTTTAPASTTTEAAPAGEPTVTYDGDTCSYSGPLEFENRTLPKFTVRNTGDVAYNFVLLALDPSLSRDDAAGLVDGFVGLGPELPAGVAESGASGIVAPGQEGSVNIAFTASGIYLPACETSPDPVWSVAEDLVVVP